MSSAPAPTDMTLDELRPVLVEAMLPHVPFDGWGRAALEAAARDIGILPATARLAFPGGAAQMVEAYVARADARMREALDTPAFHGLKVRERITTAIRTRLEQAAPHKEAARRAVNILAQPRNAPLAARLSWQTADSIWRLAGDTATDFNHYSKRTLAAAVYSATLLYWLADESEGSADSWAFLDRRIANVMQIEKAKARFRGDGERPRLVRVLGRLRYPVEG